MLLVEKNILINNIIHFRQILKEGVGESVLVDAINNHKYLYVYYAGDDTYQKGSRTIRPFVLGRTSKGNVVLRAWQEDAKNSDSYNNLTNRRRKDHEYFVTSGEKRVERTLANVPANIKNNVGARNAWLRGKDDYITSPKDVPGWRLFLVDKITTALPTGEAFPITPNDIPPLYNPNDKQMTGGIIASINIEPKGVAHLDGTDSIEKPDISKQNVDTSFFDQQGTKFKQFSNAGKKARQATANEIKILYDTANKNRQSPKELLVVDQNGQLLLKGIEEKDNLPPESVVGNLNDLYFKLVAPKKPQDDSFMKNASTQVKKELDQKNDEQMQERKTFFKT